jgi:hypothetical protein
MYRKFNARHQCEYRLLDRLKQASEVELTKLQQDLDPEEFAQLPSRVVVFESPRRLVASKGTGPGRPRKTGQNWLNLHGTSLAPTARMVKNNFVSPMLQLSPVQNLKGMSSVLQLFFGLWCLCACVRVFSTRMCCGQMMVSERACVCVIIDLHC